MANLIRAIKNHQRMLWLAAATIGLTLLMFAVWRAKQPDYILTSYVKRLANVLQQEQLPKQLAAPAVVLEPLSARRSADAMLGQRIAVTDWWSIKHCDINQLLAERNNQLGRVQTASARLKYELTILDALTECQRSNPPESILTELIATKRNQLNLLWQHLWLTDDSLSQLFTLGSDSIDLTSTDARAELATIEQSLHYLIKLADLIQRQHTTSSSSHGSAIIGDLSQHLAALHRTSLTANLWFNQQQAITTLRQANQLLEINSLACINNQVSPSNKQAQQFFTNYYAQQLQPQLAALQRYSRKLHQAFGPLIPLLPTVLQVRYQQLQQQKLLTTEIRRHAEHWQHLLRSCGMSPRPQI